jgi:hypothetical protein
MNNTVKKVQEQKGDSAAPEAQAKPVMKVVKTEDAKPEVNLKTRMAVLNALSAKVKHLNALSVNLSDLQVLTNSADKLDDCIIIKDAEGNKWSTSNTFLMDKVKETLVIEFEKKIKQIESELIEATF